mmetsp:Transcript_39748/g.88350  ORF Transcript_39748/g.88350 Transcript_39748/m.88350 type:complete len:147 (-) Transcript_39748:604-1044(-)|eukprot:CAMPEP_0202908542 /NCGR_PEP_ID=MMETSP1392-20130828/46419_1 /ASSEMBLY_ACC=CAM_ASM_000868 /TAXON_ID=225041 /ORGANISM="Chlamydomonas chlamydogama, Strain SAG 11-48b" /LENGTH=146 /DNA_ID=CAMNT_0049597939 /DNA_START=86 /DNA_END=526 /DNA_ORIENTATION=-
MAGATKTIAVVLSIALGVLLAGIVVKADGEPCSRTCMEQDCDNFNIRYGKYCGVGHGGCKGEKPCDSVDACCRKHDNCVVKTGIMQANPCHIDFLNCLEKVADKGDGFSTKCPYSMVIPSMKQGIQLALAFTTMAINKEKSDNSEL